MPLDCGSTSDSRASCLEHLIARVSGQRVGSCHSKFAGGPTWLFRVARSGLGLEGRGVAETGRRTGAGGNQCGSGKQRKSGFHGVSFIGVDSESREKGLKGAEKCIESCRCVGVGFYGRGESARQGTIDQVLDLLPVVFTNSTRCRRAVGHHQLLFRVCKKAGAVRAVP